VIKEGFMSFDLKISRGDISIGSNGSLDTVFDNSKLRQDILKILLTNLGENKFHSNYGSKIGQLDIGSVPDKDLLESDIASSAEDAIRYLIRAQNTQQKFQYLTPGEIIAGIKNVSVERDKVDPRLYNIFISVYTKNLSIITESIPVRIV
jgi:phage baseplate assembly protein W